MINTRSLTESLERNYNLNEATDESLNEAQLNENPVLAAAARAVAPVVIDFAADKLSDVIDAKLSEDDNLEEDYWNPTPWFYDLTNNYETWSGEEWNNWSQEERDAAVTKALKYFLIDNQLSEYEVEEFRRDLEDNNFHTEARILSELCGTINESLSKKYNLIETWDEEFEDEADYIMGSNLSDEEKSQEMNKLLNKYNRMNKDANLNEAQFPWEYRNGGKEYSIKDVAKSLNNLRNVFNSVAEIISSFGWSDGDEELSSIIDELFAEDYPFDKDFMEINMDVDNWVSTFIENASKIK